MLHLGGFFSPCKINSRGVGRIGLDKLAGKYWRALCLTAESAISTQLLQLILPFIPHAHTGITNYPIGVGINSAGEVTIADNHNNFNLSVFSQDGQLISALESKVKHAQCFDVALMDDGSVVLASKDYRVRAHVQ